jgi:activator of HSP90 ATPase
MFLQVSVTSVQKVDGDATVSMIRGKKKYLYDLNTSVRWKVSCVIIT